MRIIIPFLFICSVIRAQIPDKIKVEKEDDFYFFQAGNKRDTISANKGDLFYLKISGQTRCETRIEVVNGRLYKTSNDTIFQLKKNPNLQYEHYFSDSVFVEKADLKAPNARRRCNKFVTHINGALEGDGNTITIQFYNINTRKTLLTNKFYYR
jgi:hypothetical protein